MLRRMAVLAAGLGVGLAGASAASAASTALHITAGSKWTAEMKISGGGCEVDKFAANHTFSSKDGDSGTWSGGGKTISMLWTAGGATNTTFSGTFTKTPVEKYVGTFDSGSYPGWLVKGAVSGC